MGIAERRAREKRLLRQEILDAARDILVKDGYDRLTMRRVADRIEYSPTAIYLHFKDKADLVFAVCEETSASLLGELERIRAKTPDPLLALRSGLRKYVDFGLTYPQHYTATFIVTHGAATDEELARHRRADSMGMRTFAHMRQCVIDAVQQKRLAALDVEVASRTLWAAVHGVTSLLIVHPEFPWGNRDAVIDATIETALRGLSA